MKSNQFSSAIFTKYLKRLTNLSSFTLIEILIVIILLGVVAGLAVPNFASTYDQFLLNETAKDLSFFMRYAQSRSIIKSKKHKFLLDIPSASYWLEEAEDDPLEGNQATEDSFINISGKFGRIFNIPEGISVEADKTNLYFYPDGKIDKARIYLYNKRKNYFTVSTFEQDGYVQTFDFKVE